MKIPAALLVLFLAGTVVLRPQAEPTKPAEPELEMTTYYFCLLTNGANPGQLTREQARPHQQGPMDNIKRLADAGKLLVAGPFVDGGDWRGLFILKCASLDEAKAVVATDPAVVAGLLNAEVRPWLTAKGTIRDPGFPMAPLHPKP